jgi:hypothetical protein
MNMSPESNPANILLHISLPDRTIVKHILAAIPRMGEYVKVNEVWYIVKEVQYMHKNGYIGLIMSDAPKQTLHEMLERF